MNTDATELTIVVAPDSFKGSLTAAQAAKAMERGILRAAPSVKVRCCPMADGGEGTLDALLTNGGVRQLIQARGSDGGMKTMEVGIFPGETGVVEVAKVVGITDGDAMRTPVSQRTTLGVGDAVKSLLDRGCRRIHVGLGGSSTNDGGAGMLVALGLRLLDAEGNLLDPAPDNLMKMAHVDISGLDERLHDMELFAMSDVDNPLTGENGATYIFGEQKGVIADQRAKLDANLAHFATQVEKAFSHSAKDLPGSGAAGGLGFALQILGATLRSGAEVIADLIGLDNALIDADWVLTGEGRSDTQTLRGKAPHIVCKRAHARNIPVSLLSGSIDTASLVSLNQHFYGCFSTITRPISLADAMSDGESMLANASEQLTRIFLAARGF